MNKICLCCSTETSNLITMNKCKHTTFLKKYIKFKFNMQSSFICIVCHNMLKKIDTFKQQVVESIALLTNQTQNNTLKKLHNLQYSPPLIVNTITVMPESLDFEIKVESSVINRPDTDLLQIKSEETDTDNDVQDIEVSELQIVNKIDHEISDFETEEHLPKKIKKPKYIDTYKGKIRVLTLTLEEVELERETIAKEEKYLNLPYKCEFCVIGFLHDFLLKKHMVARHTKTKNTFQCSICMSVLKTKSSFDVHQKRHMTRFECQDCGKRYNHDYSAIEHYEKKHLSEDTTLSRTFTCRQCGFTTNRNRTYRYHVAKHKRHECKICSNLFVTATGLQVHMLSHKGSERLFRCPLCDKCYRAQSGLSAHRRRAHAPSAGATCAHCRTHYVSEHALHVHRATHSTHISDLDKRYICDYCDARFVRKYSLRIHITWEHLKLRTHQCTECSKVVKTKKALLHHVSYVHKKERPPRDKICHFCGRGFTTKTILQSHLRTHTGERPFQCHHCNATFAHSGALYTHIKLKHNSMHK